MTSLLETQRQLLCSMVRRIVGPPPDLETDGSFIPEMSTNNHEPREVWIAPCWTAIITVKLLFAEGNARDGRYIALVCITRSST